MGTHKGSTIGRHHHLSREIGINRTYLSNYINETYQDNFNGSLNDLPALKKRSKIV